MNHKSLHSKKVYVLNDYKSSRPSANDDFYGWVNHKWINSNSIPDDEIRYTHFIQAQLGINNHLKKVLESNVYPLGTVLYKSYTDITYKNTKCVSELKELVDIVNIVRTYEDLMCMVARLAFINVSTLIGMGVDTNVYSSCNNVLYIGQPSLALPDRAYYFDEKYRKIRQEYYDTICKTYQVIYPEYDMEKINNLATLIIDIEKKLAILFMNSADRRDTDSVLHQLKYEDIVNKYPKLHFDSVIQTLCLLSDNNLIEENFMNIIMEHYRNPKKNYFHQLENLLTVYKLEEWKEYFKYRIILTYQNLTNDQLREIHFNMFKKTIRGQKKQKVLWRSALSFTGAMLNDPISRIFVKNNYNKQIESYMKEMVKNIKAATKDRILNLEWMSRRTKKRALLKLHKLKLKLGYSKSQPRNYDHIVLTHSLIKNAIILNSDNYIHNLSKLNSNVDSDDWDLPSYIVNAYYNPSRNEIIFPASILQKPFLDLDRSDIYNYGNIGSIIGHEIIHGFDDQGAKYDENGSLNNWWSDDDKLKYQEKVNKIIAIYDAEGINGKLTAGENIADFGAVIMSLYGLEYKLQRRLTDDEIREFYTSYASHWQYLITPQAAEERRLSDPHAFSDLRVNIPLKHQSEFQRVFGIGPRDKMYVDTNDRLTIW